MRKIGVAEYMKAHGVNISSTAAASLKKQSDEAAYSLFGVDGFDYMVDHFLDDSDQVGYGIVPTNTGLKTETANAVAIALVEGDDVICIDTDDGAVFLWLVQTGNSERKVIAKNIEQFVDMISVKEQI